MTEPVQLTISGDSEPLPAPEATASSWEATPLFAAPQTIRGQLAIEAPARPVRDIYLGKCRKCSHASRVALEAVQTYDDASRYLVDTAQPFRRGYGPVCAKCPQHGVYQLRPIAGRVVDTIRCDSRCTGARGPKCDCSCGGHNHGADHS